MFVYVYVQIYCVTQRPKTNPKTKTPTPKENRISAGVHFSTTEGAFQKVAGESLVREQDETKYRDREKERGQ